jgi:hypothetical protein
MKENIMEFITKIWDGIVHVATTIRDAIVSVLRKVTFTLIEWSQNVSSFLQEKGVSKETANLIGGVVNVVCNFAFGALLGTLFAFLPGPLGLVMLLLLLWGYAHMLSEIMEDGGTAFAFA